MEMNSTENASTAEVLFWERETHDLLFQFGAPIILAVGTLGNLISIGVLRSAFFRGTSHAFLLTALAFIDTGVLYTGLLRHVIKHHAHYDIRRYSSFACKTHFFLTYLFQHLSSWTVVLITLDRMMSLWIPFRVRVVCSVRRVVFTWLLLSTTLVCINIHWLLLTDLRFDADWQTTKCSYSPDHSFAFKHIITWLDFCLLSFAPLTVILPANCLIMIKVYLMRRARQNDLVIHSSSRSQDLASVNVMLLFISFTFAATTTPIVIYFIGLDYWQKQPRAELAKTFFAYAVCNMLYYLNNAINFFLYCLSGSHFRQALYCCCRSLFGGKRNLEARGYQQNPSARTSSLRTYRCSKGSTSLTTAFRKASHEPFEEEQNNTGV